MEGSFDSPAIGADFVYVSGVDGYLYALDRTTGEFEGGAGWRRPLAPADTLPPLVSGPALDSEGKVVAVGSENGKVYAYDAATGEEVWQFTTGGKVWSTPIIRDGTVYFGSHDKNIYAVSLATGEQKWAYRTGGSVVGRPLLFRSLVIVGSFDRKLYAIEASSGIKRWSVSGGNWFWAGPVSDGTTIFAGSMDGNVYGIGPNSLNPGAPDPLGNVLWKHNMGSPVVSRPALVSRGLVVAARDGKVSLLDTDVAVATDQREIAFTNVQGGAEVTAPLFAAGDSVLVGSQDSTVTRIEIGANQAGQAFIRTHWCLDTKNGDVQCETARE
jgi:outer membrane protein assembly factor BamB